MMMKPVTGYGFEAFWHSNAVVYGSEDPTQWAEPRIRAITAISIWR